MTEQPEKLYGETVMDIHTKAFKQIEIARERYKKEGPVWTVLVMQKMIEDSEDYDADVIECIKELLKESFEEVKKAHEKVKKND